MRNRSFLVSVVILALLLWAGLILFMNRRPPSSTNQAIFLGIWGAAISCTAIPVSYAANARWAFSLGEARDLSRAIRQGLFTGMLATLLMALRFIRMLSLVTALILTLVVVMIELLISLRSH